MSVPLRCSDLSDLGSLILTIPKECIPRFCCSSLIHDVILNFSNQFDFIKISANFLKVKCVRFSSSHKPGKFLKIFRCLPMITQDFWMTSEDDRRLIQQLSNISEDSGAFPNLATTRICVKNSNTSDRVRLTRSFAGAFFTKIG